METNITSLNASLEVPQFFGAAVYHVNPLILTVLLVKPKLELISIIERSLHTDEPAASLKLLIMDIFQI